MKRRKGLADVMHDGSAVDKFMKNYEKTVGMK
jgi:hypothetical protein